MKELILLALQLSIMCTVFGFGLAATAADLLYLVRRPGLLVRSLVSVFVIMPLFTLGLVHVMNFPLTTAVVLLALSMSAVPPLLPMKHDKAGGHASYGLGLMVVLSFAAIAAVPAVIAVMERFFERPIVVAPAAIAAGRDEVHAGSSGSRSWCPGDLAGARRRLEKPVGVISNVLLPAGGHRAGGRSVFRDLGRRGERDRAGIVVFTVAGLAIGHVLGGPDPDHSVVLALSTACRHPAMALAIATTAVPDQRFGATILLYLLVNIVAGLPYIVWQRRRAAAAVRRMTKAGRLRHFGRSPTARRSWPGPAGISLKFKGHILCLTHRTARKLAHRGLEMTSENDGPRGFCPFRKGTTGDRSSGRRGSPGLHDAQRPRSARSPCSTAVLRPRRSRRPRLHRRRPRFRPANCRPSSTSSRRQRAPSSRRSTSSTRSGPDLRARTRLARCVSPTTSISAARSCRPISSRR